MTDWRVMITGSRDWWDKKKLEETLDKLYPRPTLIIEGGALGADQKAREWALNRGIPVVTVEAEWDKYGKSAGAIRNKKMIDNHEPHLVVAFPRLGSKGTYDAMEQAEKAGISVLEIKE